MKKIISLGGNYFQTTIVKAAKELGYYVINVDYLPSNPAHQFADEYHNISTLDREAVLQLAKEKEIDGILSYASDVAAPTAAYVAEKLDLSTNSLSTVEIMCKKNLFHPYLARHGFAMPKNRVVSNIDEIRQFYNDSDGMIMIKPAHSSGSKGVSKISDETQICSAYSEAQKYLNHDDVIIAEEFIRRKDYQIAGDAFIVDGEIVYFGLANEHFDLSCNPLVPVGESFPADLSDEKRIYARQEIQKALKILDYKNGAVNLDFMFDQNGKVFIIELGPRNGGNLITDAIKIGGGPDLAKATILNAVGETVQYIEDVPVPSHVASYIWHARENGIFDDLVISDKLRKKIVRTDLFIKSGEKVFRYNNGAYGIGAALLKFDSKEEMLYMMDHMMDYYYVKMR